MVKWFPSQEEANKYFRENPKANPENITFPDDSYEINTYTTIMGTAQNKDLQSRQLTETALDNFLSGQTPKELL